MTPFEHESLELFGQAVERDPAPWRCELCDRIADQCGHIWRDGKPTRIQLCGTHSVGTQWADSRPIWQEFADNRAWRLFPGATYRMREYPTWADAVRQARLDYAGDEWSEVRAANPEVFAE